MLLLGREAPRRKDMRWEAAELMSPTSLLRPAVVIVVVVSGRCVWC